MIQKHFSSFKAIVFMGALIAQGLLSGAEAGQGAHEFLDKERVVRYALHETQTVTLWGPIGFTEKNPAIVQGMHSLQISQEARALFSDLYKQGKTDILFDLSDQSGKIPVESSQGVVYEGLTVLRTGKIFLNAHLLAQPMQFCSVLLFEMINVCHRDLLALPGKISTDANQYALLTERAEYETFDRRARILKNYVETVMALEDTDGIKQALHSLVRGRSLASIVSENFQIISFKDHWRLQNRGLILWSHDTEHEPISHTDAYRREYGLHSWSFVQFQPLTNQETAAAWDLVQSACLMLSWDAQEAESMFFKPQSIGIVEVDASEDSAQKTETLV